MPIVGVKLKVQLLGSRWGNQEQRTVGDDPDAKRRGAGSLDSG
jgi:hypothetical protein